MKQINEQVPKDVVKVLVANKVDLSPDEWEVQSLEGKTLADKFGVTFMEVSAKTGANVQELFQKIGEEIVEFYLPNRVVEDPRTYLSRRMDSDKKKKKDCQC